MSLNFLSGTTESFQKFSHINMALCVAVLYIEVITVTLAALNDNYISHHVLNRHKSLCDFV